jgi:hypothetical protein
MHHTLCVGPCDVLPSWFIGTFCSDPAIGSWRGSCPSARDGQLPRTMSMWVSTPLRWGRAEVFCLNAMHVCVRPRAPQLHYRQPVRTKMPTRVRACQVPRTQHHAILSEMVMNPDYVWVCVWRSVTGTHDRCGRGNGRRPWQCVCVCHVYGWKSVPRSMMCRSGEHLREGEEDVGRGREV